MSDVKLTEKEKEFYRGFAVAVAELARRGWPSQAIDIMHANGVTLQQLRNSGVEDFDLKPLATEWRRSA